MIQTEWKCTNDNVIIRSHVMNWPLDLWTDSPLLSLIISAVLLWYKNWKHFPCLGVKFNFWSLRINKYCVPNEKHEELTGSVFFATLMSGFVEWRTWIMRIWNNPTTKAHETAFITVLHHFGWGKDHFQTVVLQQADILKLVKSWNIVILLEIPWLK